MHKTAIHIMALFGSLALLWSQPARADLIQEVGTGRLNWSQGSLTVTGSGVAAKGKNAGQARLLAQRAAMSDAYRQLAEAVNGVQVMAETTVKDFVTESDTIRLSVSAVIKGARQNGPTRYLSDGTVEVDVTMPIYGNGSLAQAVQLGQAMEQQFSKPYSSLDRYLTFRGWNLLPEIHSKPAAPARGLRLAQAKAYTGLIIDASGLAADPAMGPFVVGAGARLHPNQKIGVDPEKIVQQGPLHYVEDLEEAREDHERVGENPLIVRAKAAVGNPVRSNILLDESTAAQVMDINAQAHFLEALKVTLVL
ncbi:MAG: LPP20 family lipoprotein [Candidatus Sericytochromatia bacterium]|nr:LPP20 family lipoprotein [Candidatus Sericytochromatia bacterium]